MSADNLLLQDVSSECCRTVWRLQLIFGVAAHLPAMQLVSCRNLVGMAVHHWLAYWTGGRGWLDVLRHGPFLLLPACHLGVLRQGPFLLLPACHVGVLRQGQFLLLPACHVGVPTSPHCGEKAV
jgi:hypothetical protein